MKKKIAKQIKEIADRLPPVYDRCASGFEMVEVGDTKKPIRHVYTVPVNHERRLRHAFESNGMDGIKAYLQTIIDLQKKRNEQLEKQRASEPSAAEGDVTDRDADAVPGNDKNEAQLSQAEG